MSDQQSQKQKEAVPVDPLRSNTEEEEKKNKEWAEKSEEEKRNIALEEKKKDVIPLDEEDIQLLKAYVSKRTCS